MSPRISRRRSLALPFVVTIAAAASGCVVHSDPAPARSHRAPVAATQPSSATAPAGPAGRAEPGPADAAGPAGPAEPMPTVVANPPAPTTRAPVVVNPPAPSTSSPAAPAKSSPAAPAKTAPTKRPANTKKPVVVANPPRLPEAPKTGHVFTKRDGTCWWVNDSKCPPKATCNPPPPSQVRCTSDGDDKPSR